MANIIFAGTPEFSVHSLMALTEIDSHPSLVITQPDRRAGRGKKIKTSPVKIAAEKLQIPISQPASINESEYLEYLKQIDIEIIVVAAYGMIFSEELLAIPKLGCVNIHASLLPSWRGASPVQATILNGDEETGITLMKMTKGLDSGPIYSQHKMKLTQTESGDVLMERLGNLSAKAIRNDFKKILKQNLKAESQKNSEVSYSSKIEKKDAELDWSKPAEILAREVRAFNSNPGAYFIYKNEPIKCWQAIPNDKDSSPGKVISSDRNGIEIGCGSGSLVILELQRPGKRKITAGEFAAQVDMNNKELLS
tara:strand:- start:56211 stop:57137 length:927 start_codon:yes stop_codon:yes gene_type:complete